MNCQTAGAVRALRSPTRPGDRIERGFDQPKHVHRIATRHDRRATNLLAAALGQLAHLAAMSVA
jgi:hypothetical protein